MNQDLPNTSGIQPTDPKEHPTIVSFPPMISGTSSLGNLYEELDPEKKLALVKAYLECVPDGGIFDTAGKYGAGLALEELGRCLDQLKIDPSRITISNKLGWYRVPLNGPEPTFEKGVWKNLQHDAIQKISYEGILECYEQGNTLLGNYRPQLLSVHDPDEYLSAPPHTDKGRAQYHDIQEAYRALQELKAQGKGRLIGIGAKDWHVIQRITADMDLDWVMLANSLTIFHHPPALLDLVAKLHHQGTIIINSAVFHGGFLVGSDYFNYQYIDKEEPRHQPLLAWRTDFFDICRQFDITPAHACIQFGASIPGITSVALNSTSHLRMKKNLAMITTPIPPAFWSALKNKGLIAPDFLYL